MCRVLPLRRVGRFDQRHSAVTLTVSASAPTRTSNERDELLRADADAGKVDCLVTGREA